MTKTGKKWDLDWGPYRAGVRHVPTLRLSREWDGHAEHPAAIMTKPKDVTELWLRQRGWCALCHEPLDPPGTHAPDHPDSAQIDHWVPRAKGGMHTLINTQAVHRSCNLAKGAQSVALTWVRDWFPAWRGNGAYAQGYEVWLDVRARWIRDRRLCFERS